MIIAVAFDGTIVEDGPFDATTPLQLKPVAKSALAALKRAGHVLLLVSPRANRALREDPYFDPLVRTGARKVDVNAWQQARPLHEQRYRQMVDFVLMELPGIFDAIDDGQQGYPDVDMLISGKTVRVGRGGPIGVRWETIVSLWGAPVRPRASKILPFKKPA